MTPTHTNKLGARYRYYVSHATLQKRTAEAGSVSRVPAPDIENAVVKMLRERLGADSNSDRPIPADDRDLVERYVGRVVIKRGAIEIGLAGDGDRPENRENISSANGGGHSAITITVPFSAMIPAAARGILHSPSPCPTMSSEGRDVLLAAIAKARSWIDDIMEGRAASFAEIAKREGKVERHIRLLAPLAFVSPRIISGIIDGSAPAGLTVTGLAKSLPCGWNSQENQIVSEHRHSCLGGQNSGL